MAVKFSDFTEATDSATVEKIVGYTSTGDLNLQIPPANLDTTYVVSTTDGTAPIVNLTATKAGSTPASSLLNFTGSGATTLTGNASTSTIDISSDPGVTTFTNVNGTYISAGTVNTAAAGAVTLGAIDLNAIDGTSDGATRFLSKDNTWDVPSYSGGGAGVYLPLAGGTMTGNLDLGVNNRVLFGTANDLQIYHDGANAKIVNSTGQLNINSTAGVTLDHANATKLATATTGITITGKATSTATVAGDGATTLTTKGYVDGLASDVTSVNSGTPFNSTGVPLAISPTSGAVIVSSAIYDGGTNIGVVPDGGTATTFLKGDGNWATPDSGVTGTGTANKIPFWNSTTVLGDSLLAQDASTTKVTVNGLLEVLGDGVSQDGRIQLNCSQNSHGVTIQSPAHAANASYTLKLPETVGSAGQVLTSEGVNPSQLTWTTPNTGGYTTEFIGSSTTVSAVKDYLYILANPSAVTITLPASPADGDTIGIANNLDLNGGQVGNLLVAPGTGGNTDKIMGDASDLVLDNASAAFDLVFSSADAPNGSGWTILGAN